MNKDSDRKFRQNSDAADPTEFNSLLRVMKQGVLFFDHRYIVIGSHSDSAEKILGKSGLAGHSLKDLLNLDQITFDLYREWIGILLNHENEEQLKRFKELNPLQQFEIDNGTEKKILLSELEIIFGSEIKFILFLEDISEKLKLQNAVQQEKARQAREHYYLTTLIKEDPHELEILFDELELVLKITNDDHWHNPNATLLQKTAGAIHGLKGSLSMNGLSSLAESLHLFESELKSYIDKDSRTDLNTIRHSLLLISSELQELLTHREILIPKRNVISINKEYYLDLIRSLERRKHVSVEYVLQGLRKLTFRTWEEFCRKFDLIIRSVCQQTGKKIQPLKILMGEYTVSEDFLAYINPMMIHLVKNAAYHGVQFPGEAMPQGGEPGEIITALFDSETYLDIMVSDNGRGLNESRVIETAVNKNLISSEQAETLNERQIIELLFIQGFSTLPEADLFSGRGIGLFDVKTRVEELGGSVLVENRKDRGMAFTLRYPKEVLEKSGFIISE